MFNIQNKYWIFTISLNVHIYLLASKYIYSYPDLAAFQGNYYKKSGVCFKFTGTYLITNKSFWTFKCNIFMVKIVANVALTKLDLNHHSLVVGFLSEKPHLSTRVNENWIHINYNEILVQSAMKILVQSILYESCWSSEQCGPWTLHYKFPGALSHSYLRLD